uniref:DUF7027 domain-containing protein n=1 Tax=Plectus sambesii TaxID=2011161 RepID=A0A914WEQ7_9BILA
MSHEQPPFDPNDPKYIICCGQHIMDGAKMVAYFYNVGVVLIVIISSIGLTFASKSPHMVTFNVIVFVSFFATIPVLGCLWHGITNKREKFLIPTLICMVISLILIGLFTLACFGIAINMLVRKKDVNGCIWIMVMVMCAFLFALQLWFFSILKNAYYYLKYRRSSPTGRIMHVLQSEQVYIAGKS